MSAPRKFIFDTSDKKNVIFQNGYYSLLFNQQIQCSKIAVLQVTMIHSFYNVDYYNNEVIIKKYETVNGVDTPILPEGADPIINVDNINHAYLRVGHYKSINELTDELLYQITAMYPDITNDKIDIVLNNKTFKLSMRLKMPNTTLKITFTNSFRLFGCNRDDTLSLNNTEITILHPIFVI